MLEGNYDILVYIFLYIMIINKKIVLGHDFLAGM